MAGGELRKEAKEGVEEIQQGVVMILFNFKIF